MNRMAVDDSRHQGERGSEASEYVILVTPPGTGRILKIQLKKWQVVAGVALGSGLLVLGLLAAVLYGRIAAEARAAARLRDEIERLGNQLGRLSELQAEVARLEAKRRQVLQLSGVIPDGDGDENIRISAATDYTLFDPAESGDGAGSDGGRLSLARRVDGTSIENLRGLLEYVPCAGPVSRGYGAGGGEDRPHLGVDIAGSAGMWIVASGPGIVCRAGEDPVFGLLVVVDHGAGVQTLYGHNSRLVVEEGDRVDGGERLAQMGNTGLSSAPHLHFEVLIDGEALDPALVFPSLDVASSGK